MTDVGLWPFDKAAEWAQDAEAEKTSTAAPVTAPALPTDDHPGTQVSDLGWLVLGGLLILGTAGLVYYGAHKLSPAAMLSRKFARR